jgi:hypothetical protein
MTTATPRIAAIIGTVLCLLVALPSAGLGDPFPKFLDESEWRDLPPNLMIEAREIELWGQINTYLAAKGYQLGSGAFFGLNNAVQKAALLVQALPEKLQRTRANQAAGNFRTIIDTMIYEVEQTAEADYGRYRIIGEENLASALRVLCPIWPLCN